MQADTQGVGTPSSQRFFRALSAFAVSLWRNPFSVFSSLLNHYILCLKRGLDDHFSFSPNAYPNFSIVLALTIGDQTYKESNKSQGVNAKLHYLIQ